MKCKNILRSNWILILEFILLHHFKNILQHQENNGTMSFALQRSEKCTTGLGKDQCTHRVPLGFIHQQPTTSNGAIHKKMVKTIKILPICKDFLKFALITSIFLFFHIIRCMPAKKWFLPFFIWFYKIYIIS